LASDATTRNAAAAGSAGKGLEAEGGGREGGREGGGRLFGGVGGGAATHCAGNDVGLLVLAVSM